MKMKFFKQGLVLAVLLTLFTTSANATLIVAFERLSDTSVRMTGSGSLTGSAASNAHILHFDNLFSSFLTGIINEGVFSSSTMTIGSNNFVFSYTISTGFGWEGASSGIYGGSLSGAFSAGDSMSSGYVDLSIAGVTSSPVFASVGSTGDIYWGVNNGNVVGSWTMVDSSIPEPATLALMGLGLLGLGLQRRKRL